MGVRLGWSKGTPEGVRGRRVVIEEHREPYNRGLYSVMIYGPRGIVDGSVGLSPCLARKLRDRFERTILAREGFYVDRGNGPPPGSDAWTVIPARHLVASVSG